MASVARSEGSLPLTNLAHLQAQLLQDQRVLPQAIAANVDDNSGATVTTGNDNRSGHDDTAEVIDKSAHAYRTPVSSPKESDKDAPKIPSLGSAKSAPAAEMAAMVNASPSQEAFEDYTRASSFPGGDTQPNDTQVYLEFSKSMAQAKKEDAITPKKEKVLLQISPGGNAQHTYNTEAMSQTPRTAREGDTGYVNLEAGWDELPSPTADDESELGASVNGDAPEDKEEERRIEFRKPALPAPKTPALAGHKRRRSGEILMSEASAKETPGLVAAFGFHNAGGQMLSGTQLFEQTQQRSSPLPGAPRSDPAATRPSPNMVHHMTMSSPNMTMSSPIYSRLPSATAGEPSERYITTKESQERKRRQLQRDFDLRRTSNDLEDEEEDTQERLVERRRLKRNWSDQAQHELNALRTDVRPRLRPATSSSPRKPTFGLGPEIVDLRTPGAVMQERNTAFDFLDGNDSGGEQDDADEAVADDLHMDERIDEDEQSVNDEYDELGETVLKSQPAEPEGFENEENEEMLEPMPEIVNAELQRQVEVGHELPEEVEQDAAHVALVQGSSQVQRSQLQKKSQTATQHTAIADSQPLRKERGEPSVPAIAEDRSPSCSYVPGSQYAGNKSEEQTLLHALQAQKSTNGPDLSEDKSQGGGQPAVPSSPPAAATGDTGILDDNTAKASLERRKMLQQLQSVPYQTAEDIPDSDLGAVEPEASRPNTAQERPNTESNNAPFSTARSHLSAAGPSLSQAAPLLSPSKGQASQQSQSPRTKAGVRHFADITAAGSPTKASGEVMDDVDDVMNGLLNAEDRQYIEMTSSPPRERAQKRRRTAGKPSVRSSSPSKAPAGTKDLPSATVSRHAALENQAVHHDLQQDGGSEGEDAGNGLEERALRSSPSKANEQRPESPRPEGTPESVKQREMAGAKAASQLVAKRSSRKPKPPKTYGSARKPRSKLQVSTSALSDDAAVAAKRESERKSIAVGDAQPDGERNDDVPMATEGQEEPEIDETVMETHEEQEEVHAQQSPQEALVLAPHRVFALFKGNYNMFYPAVWLGASAEGGHRVKFDDGSTTSLDTHQVARLELVLGDQVKIDWPGMKKQTWIVKGFGRAEKLENGSSAVTDVHGHAVVKVQAKSTRHSISGPNAVAQGEGEVFEMAVEVVYLTHAMWPNFFQRKFMAGVQRNVQTRLETPSTGVQTPISADTPGSRSRRATASTTKPDLSIRDESFTTSRSPEGLFSGMAFAVSYANNENEKANVTRLIQRNGGIILGDGFEELFDPPDLDQPATSESGLQLREEHKHLAFVALIADKHTRRAKYIQALALGIPTLSGRWIIDALDTAKNLSLSTDKPAPLPWTKYLLAAGESSYLGGAIRSRDLAAYDAAGAKLADTVAHRPLLLNGEGVLIVAAKKSKPGVWEKRKSFAFLTVALGAGYVKRVPDLQEAKALVDAESERWKFVFVGDGSIAEAGAMIFGGAAGAGAGKKRKRGDLPAAAATGKVDAKAMFATDGKVKVVNDEFVVQSLILGALVD